MNGGELQDTVIELARLFGWHVAHFRPAMTKHGWRTPVAADGKGWPDLVLVRDRVLYREIKMRWEKLSPEQEAWGEWFTLAGVDWAVWRPEDWTSGLIEADLRKRAIGSEI